MTNMRYGHMSLFLALYGVTTILTASQWICNNIYDNRVNCRCMGFASLIHTNFSFEQQDDHCPNGSTTPLPMWYIVSPPLGFPSTHNNLNRFRLDEECNSPHPPPLFISCVALSYCWWGKWKYKWWKWKWWSSSITWNAKLPLPKGLQIVKMEHLLISSGAF